MYHLVPSWLEPPVPGELCSSSLPWSGSADKCRRQLCSSSDLLGRGYVHVKGPGLPLFLGRKNIKLQLFLYYVCAIGSFLIDFNFNKYSVPPVQNLTGPCKSPVL